MGILFGVYLSFGLSPLYWNLLHGVSALEMVSHQRRNSEWKFVRK